jgi:3-oxoacyl-[acyl-carrier-protein] synthase II
MSSDDVVITGLGATTPLGGDVATTWAGLLEGRSGVVTFEDWADDMPVRFGGRMAVDPFGQLPRAKARRMDRVQQAALVAAAEAWADAGFEGNATDAGLDPDRLAVSLGSGIGGVVSLIDQHDLMLAKGPTKVSPMLIPMDMRPSATDSICCTSTGLMWSSSAGPRRACIRSRSAASRRCGR